MVNPLARPTFDSTDVTVDSTDVTVDSGSTATVGDYLDLVTAWQSNPKKSRFLATVAEVLRSYVELQAVISTFSLAFDVEYAEGAFLDADGEWIGRSRSVPVPLPNTFFSVGSELLGVGRGYIRGKFDSDTGISVLPDDLYRKLLFAKIAANSWDGTVDGLLAILRTYFDDLSTNVIVDDACPYLSPPLLFSVGDPARGVGFGSIPGGATDKANALGYGMKIGFSGKIPSLIDLAILSAGLIPLKAAGFGLTTYVTTVDRTPIFAVGVQDRNLAGVGSGAIGAPPGYVADKIAQGG